MILFGNSDFSVRLQAALLGSMSILLTYKLGEILWSREAGVLGAFLLAINAFHLRYSQEARHYGLMVFFALLSLIFLVKALENGRGRMWILFGICASLLVYTHYFALLVLASEVVFAAWVILESWLSSRRECSQTSLDHAAQADLGHETSVPKTQSPQSGLPTPPSRHLPGARRQALFLVAVIALVALSYLPWLPFLQQQLVGRHIQFEGLGDGTLPRAELSVRFFTEALRVYTKVDGLPLLLFVALFLLGLISSPLRHGVLFALWIVLPFVVPFVVRASHFFSYRYAIFVVPIFLLGVARGTSVLGRLLTPRLPVLRDHERSRAALYSVVVLSVFGYLAITPITDYYLREKADFRGVARYLQQTLRPGDVVATDGVKFRRGQDADWTERSLSYYMDHYHMEQTPTVLVERGFWANLQDVAHEEGEVVAVLSSRQERAGWLERTDVTIIGFKSLYVVRLPQPSGDSLQDGVSMLETLADLFHQPSDASFDVHLALAEAYADLGEQSEADSQVVLASAAMPDDHRAVDDLAETISELQPLLRVQLQDFSLGDTLSMRGYSIHPTSLQAAEAVDITLWWQVEAKMQRDYTAFIHIVGHDGIVLTQEDTLLQSSNGTSSKWRVGQVQTNEHQLLLPSDAEPGQYTVVIGVYYWKTGERLPIWDGEGQRVPDDAVALGAISVDAPHTVH
jgi:hypothetical protein